MKCAVTEPQMLFLRKFVNDLALETVLVSVSRC